MSHSFNLENLDVRRSLAESNLREAARLAGHRDQANRGALLERMARDHVTLGLHAFYREDNQAALKHHFHISGQLHLASLRESPGPQLASRSPLLYALLSDSPTLVERYGSPGTVPDANGKPAPIKVSTRVNLLQRALRGEMDRLEKRLADPSRATAEATPDREFYTLLCERDQAGLEALLTQQARRTEARLKQGKEPGDALHKRYMASCTLYVKLCWLRGTPVVVDHPLVPMALMANRPLPRYDDVYPFLEADKAPGSRVLQRLGNWIRPGKKAGRQESDA